MPTINDLQTIGSIWAVSTDTNPSLLGGVFAPLNSFGTANDGSGFFVKTGALDTDWTLLPNSTQIAGSYVPYTGATADVYLGIRTVTTPTVYGSLVASGTLNLVSTSNATKGVIQIGSTDLVNIGNAVTTNQKILRVGQDTAFMDIGSWVTDTSFIAVYVNKTPTASNYLMIADNTYTVLNSPLITVLRANTKDMYRCADVVGLDIQHTFYAQPQTSLGAGAYSFSKFGSQNTNWQWTAGTISSNFAFNSFERMQISFDGATTDTADAIRQAANFRRT